MVLAWGLSPLVTALLPSLNSPGKTPGDEEGGALNDREGKLGFDALEGIGTGCLW